ncbi:MAG: hypothetical protein KDD04_03995 [Sinomicrobium sp.]|nr:hypothetical protein [Sinomicrobium sp.]
MNKLVLLCSFLLLMNVPAQQEEKKEVQPDNRYNTSNILSINDSFFNHTALVIRAENEKETALVRAKKEDADLASIVYIEEEDEVTLGFDTAEYLPRGFDPYAPFFDIHSVTYIEAEEEITLGFDTAAYLPRGFNPHEAFFDIHSITYIEEKEEIVLGFDTKKYLPEGFNAHAKPSML